ncbi:hypothetical protein [Kribbella ginsengisoli]|uniref:Uncharacterized protein n=1 Tax=Kribbella ginsengisoli TaxID=363865 RepID=A0ABP6Z4L2_9ACTN
MNARKEYERLGDIEKPFSLTKQHERNQSQSEDIRRAVTYIGSAPSLTLEELAAGKPCPGCLWPLHDSERWESKGTMFFKTEERERYDAEEVRYKNLHGECRAGRWGVEGSLTNHCSRCCPSLPISPAVAAKLAGILSRRPAESELMRWRLRLYCGHVIEKKAHRTHLSVRAAFSGGVRCAECGLDPATIVDAEAIGIRRASQAEPAPRQDRRTKAELAARVVALEQQVEELMRKGTMQ